MSLIAYTWVKSWLIHLYIGVYTLRFFGVVFILHIHREMRLLSLNQESCRLTSSDIHTSWWNEMKWSVRFGALCNNNNNTTKQQLENILYTYTINTYNWFMLQGVVFNIKNMVTIASKMNGSNIWWKRKKNNTTKKIEDRTKKRICCSILVRIW